MNARGFTLLELVIACALLVAVAGTVASLAGPIRAAYERSLGTSDLAGAARAVLERLAADVRDAGSGAAIAPPGVRLSGVLATIEPLRDLDVDFAGVPARALRLTTATRAAPQGLLISAAAPAVTHLDLAHADRCHSQAPGCGFSSGMMAVLHDGARAQVVRVHSVAGSTVLIHNPLSVGFPAGAALTAVTVTSYGVRPEADGTFRLVRVTTGGSEQPILQNVVDFEVTVSGDDVIRIGRVDVLLRVQAAAASARGTAGSLFRRAGTSTSGARSIPDLELRVSLTARNKERQP
jgi:Tfp pilus assembly protein PilW